MSKLKNLVAKAVKDMKGDIQKAANEAVANAPQVKAPKAPVGSALKHMDTEAQRTAELGYIVKSIRGGALTDAEAKDLEVRFKAIGTTSDISELIPSGFTGALTRDIREQLTVTGLFPYKEIDAPGKYDTVALDGITAYLTDEASNGTDSSESYTTMIYLVKKVMGVVRKSYEAIDDSLIDLAAEVRNELINAIAEAIENAIVNGDDSATHMDADVTAANDPRKAFKGIRKLALAKASIDAGGAAMTEDDWLKVISDAQLAGGKYLNQAEVSKGNVVFVVPQSIYNQIRLFPSFRTKEKAGGLATLFGAPVDSIFGIPVVMTPYIPADVDETGVVNSDATKNTKAMGVLVNRKFYTFYSVRNSAIMETQKDIVNQSIIFTASQRVGASGLFDRNASDPTAVDATRKTMVAIVNVAK